MRFCHVKDSYIEFLRKYDERVPINKNESRMYIGVVLEVDDHKYYAPLSSPKQKHLKMKNTHDFRKIKGGKLGAINFNNMIPITEQAIINFDLLDIEDAKYQLLLKTQIIEIRHDAGNIKTVAEKLRSMIINNTCSEKLQQRCCDFKLLESVYMNYKEWE